MLDVLCVADMCIDLVLSGNVRPRFSQQEQLIGDYQIELGGSANIFATQFARLGGRAGVIGWVGRDPFGSFARTRLEKLGVDTSLVGWHDTLKTGLGVALVEPGDRAILTYSGTIDAVTPAQLEDKLAGATHHWHIASYYLLRKLRDFWPHWLRKLKDKGCTISLDPNWDPDERWDGVAELLPLVDVFFPNEAEALALTGAGSIDEAGNRLAGQVPVTAIKQGASGVTVFADGQRASFPARTALREEIADTIGAGDNFDAGFLHARLRKRSIGECVDLGQRCAWQSLFSLGGIEGQFSLAPDGAP